MLSTTCTSVSPLIIVCTNVFKICNTTIRSQLVPCKILKWLLYHIRIIVYSKICFERFPLIVRSVLLNATTGGRLHLFQLSQKHVRCEHMCRTYGRLKEDDLAGNVIKHGKNFHNLLSSVEKTFRVFARDIYRAKTAFT